jgi:hypothetical protein
VLKPLMVMPLLTLPEVTRVSTSMALKVMVCMLPAVVTVSWFITEAENGPLKLVPTSTSTVSVLSPVVVKPDGLPVQVTVSPEAGGSGLHCATAGDATNGSAASNRLAPMYAKADRLPCGTIALPHPVQGRACARGCRYSIFGFAELILCWPALSRSRRRSRRVVLRPRHPPPAPP